MSVSLSLSLSLSLYGELPISSGSPGERNMDPEATRRRRLKEISGLIEREGERDISYTKLRAALCMKYGARMKTIDEYLTVLYDAGAWYWADEKGGILRAQKE